jgi:aryl-alcohol dehydrogenase-like predicted oxidoreductase
MKAKIGASRLGFGCAAVPGRLTTREALTLLETAFACGIRHFDTARMYCNGQSEAVLGELVRQRPGEQTLVTKAGIAPRGRLSRGLTRFAAAFHLARAQPRFGRFAPDEIRRSVETSLRKLKTDYVDALLLHEIKAHDVRDELKAALMELRAQGRVGCFGIATSIEDSEAIIAAHPDLCEIVQVPVGWLDWRRALPPHAQLIVHSVLGARLAAFLNRLKTNDHVSRRFKEETGLDAGDTEKIGRLMLQAAMLRNQDGLTLFATARLDRVRRNCELLTAKPEVQAIEALERAMAAKQDARHGAAP